MCTHEPPCPDAGAIDRDAARTVAAHPEQGWTLLCNGVIVFEDTGELLPDGSCVEPHRGPAPHVAGYIAHAANRTPSPVLAAPIAA